MQNGREIISISDYFLIYFPFSRDIVNDIKTRFNKPSFKPKTDKSEPHWAIRRSEYNVAQLEEFCSSFDFSHEGIVFTKELSKVEALEKKKNKLRSDTLRLSNKSKSDYSTKLEGVKLKPWQKTGCDFGLHVLRNNKGWFLGDDMGLGKTLQTISVVEDMNIYPVLVISTASLKYNWRDEYIKFNPSRKCSIGDEFDPSADVHIINYDIADKVADDLIQYKFKTLVCDESHYLKSPKSKRTKAVKKLSKKIQYKILISGTPIKNKVSDIVTQLDILGILDKEFGGWFDFVKRYCKAYKEKWGSWNTDGKDNLDELNKKLKSTVFISRKKTDVFKDLDPKNYQHYNVDLSNLKEYKEAKIDLISWIKNGDVTSKYVKEALSLGVEDIDQYLEDKYKSLEKVKELVAITYLRQLAGRGKIDAAIDWISNFLETTDEKLVVFAHHKEVQDKIIDHFIKKRHTAFITSGIKSLARSEMIRKFQEDDNIRLIVCSMGSAAEGVTLTAASQMLIVEYGWTPAILKQVEDRIHRIGQTKKVWIHYLNAVSSIDNWMKELLVGKQSIVTEALGDDTFFIKDHISKNVMRKIINE